MGCVLIISVLITAFRVCEWAKVKRFRNFKHFIWQIESLEDLPKMNRHILQTTTSDLILIANSSMAMSSFMYNVIKFVWPNGAKINWSKLDFEYILISQLFIEKKVKVKPVEVCESKNNDSLSRRKQITHYVNN